MESTQDRATLAAVEAAKEAGVDVEQEPPDAERDYLFGRNVASYAGYSREETKEWLKGGDPNTAAADLACIERVLTAQGLAFKEEAPKKLKAADVADPLPDGFPAKEKLEAGGVVSLTQVKALSDESLLQIPGIGPSSIPKIRAAAE